MELAIQCAQYDDLTGLLTLYAQLHEGGIPAIDEEMLSLWQRILQDKNQHVLVGKIDDRIVSGCVLVIVPNLTHDSRPYALIENVVTDAAYRNRGFATAVLDFAKRIAVNHRCYKIMLMTGSKLQRTLDFYRKAGYSAEDKTAFIQWI